MPADGMVLGPGEGRRFWTSLSYATAKVESKAGRLSPETLSEVYRTFDSAPI